MHDTMDFDPDASFPAEDIRLLQQAIMTLTEVIDRNKKLADFTEQLLTTKIGCCAAIWIAARST